jgi:hypothetical protein
MAIPGDPFRTQELDELRSHQRRHLRHVPPTLLERNHHPALRPAGRPDGFDETALRLLAEQEARNLVELLENFETHATIGRQLEFLHSHSDLGGLEDFGPMLVDLASLLAASQTSLFSTNNDDRAARLERFVKLAVWADQLAEDGYRDPRLGDSVVAGEDVLFGDMPNGMVARGLDVEAVVEDEAAAEGRAD